MNRLFLVVWSCASLMLFAGQFARAQDKTKVLLDVTNADAVVAQVRINDKPDATSISTTDKGLEVVVGAEGTAGYPGVAVRPAEGEVWDLSAFGHVVATVTNTGDKRIYVTVRVDNKGDHTTKPWSAEPKVINPGRTETIKVMFGRSFGYKPTFKLDPSKITGILIFANKSGDAMTFRVDSLIAGGVAGEEPQMNPAHIRIIPKAGVLLGPDTSIEKDMKIASKTAKVEVVGQAIQLQFAQGAKEAKAAIRPPVGRWNLKDHLQVQVTLTNTSSVALTPTLQLESDKGPSDAISQPIAAGQTATITVPFRSASIWQGPQSLEKKPYPVVGGSQLASNVVAGITIDLGDDAEAKSVRVDSIVANMPPPEPLPEWVGKRPPVEGDWKMTFEENFDAPKIDFSRWNIYTANFWDKRSHFSKDNVILEDGLVKLRFEKKTGAHNDEPGGKVTDYATGFLDTYGKWVQRYGYFEARMKLPKAPGMWPAFWLMPDRGVAAGPQWKRADTANGGMEFDIMEYLSRWGPNRHTIVFHFDGYGKDHKATGTAAYIAPDKDGYVTSGLLWLPGLAVIYCNGKETARWESPRISDVESYIIFTAVSGGWDNDPIDDAQLPSDFVIDYVRVWQRADLASAVDGPKPNDAGPSSHKEAPQPQP